MFYSRKTLVYLILALYHMYPDYDFSAKQSFHRVYTHCAVKTTGNVFCYEELNIKTKNWKELLTDETFTRDDLITIQNPNALDQKVLLDFDHVKQNLKIDDEGTQMDPETALVKISSFSMQLNNFTGWTLHSRVKEEVEKTCFKYFTRFPTTEIKIPKQMIVDLLRFYDYEEEHFVFGDTKVDLGLEDVMYITGLPIDGKQISGFEPGDPIETIVNHLSLNPVEANDLLSLNKSGKKSHNISLKSLKEKFESIAVTEENVNSHVKVYLLFLLGNVLFTTFSFTSVSVIYLPFLEVLDIDNYAWGAAVHATLKVSMNKVRKGNTTLTGFAYLLMVFAFERFKCLREIFNFAIPSQFPLMLGWVNVTSENLRNRSLMPIKKACYDKLREMTDEDVDLLPYRRDGLEAELADQFKSQSWMVYAKVYTICFENIAKHPVHTCYKQLGLELGNLKKCDDFRKKMILQERGPGKDKNWRDFNLFYTHCNTRWAKRNMHLIKKNFQMFGPLVNYLQEGDVDERETESPPRCNLPTPRDEVQAPIFDSSLSHEALAIQTPQEVLYSQMSPQPTDDDFDHDHDMDDSLIYGETVEVENPNNDVDAGVGNLGVGNANNDEEVEVGNPNNDEEVGDGIPNNDVIGVEVGNNNNDVLDAGVDNHDEGEHNNNVRNYTRGEGVLRTKPRMRTMYTPEQELRVRKKTKLRKPKIK